MKPWKGQTMKINNRRGEVFTMTVLILVGLLGAFLGGSKYGKFVGIGGSDQKMVHTIKSEPILVGPKGNQCWVQKTEESYTNPLVVDGLFHRPIVEGKDVNGATGGIKEAPL